VPKPNRPTSWDGLYSRHRWLEERGSYFAFEEVVGNRVVLVREFKWAASRVETVVLPLWYWESLMAKEKVELVESILERALAGVSPDGYSPAVSDLAFAGLYPALHAFLTSSLTPKGAPRKTSSITLFCEDGSFKASLNERELGLSLYATGESVQGALEALELRLCAPKVEWRRNPWIKGRASKKTS
jgi:hypothetical protein